jgi:hypothetical protein
VRCFWDVQVTKIVDLYVVHRWYSPVKYLSQTTKYRMRNTIQARYWLYSATVINGGSCICSKRGCSRDSLYIAPQGMNSDLPITKQEWELLYLTHSAQVKVFVLMAVCWVPPRERLCDVFVRG